MNRLTTKKSWEEHWSRRNLMKKIGKHYWFSDLFQKELKDKKYESLIEIGGYPGYFSIYFKKYWGYDTTLLDYINSIGRIKELLRYNDLGPKEVNIIPSDFLAFKPDNQFDVVFSYGFIEHFSNIEEILGKHWKLVKPGGKLIIIYPNFLGINGLLQGVFDPDNLIKHNLSIMVIKNLRGKLLSAGINKCKISYYGGLGVWLEDLNRRSPILRMFIYALAALGKVVNILGFNNRFISPHIILVAKK